MRTRRSLAVLLLLLVPLPALAHGVVFFEYAPDAWESQRLSVAGLPTPSELFMPVASFPLSGFDFWVDNIGSSGLITFSLVNNQGETLATRSVTLPYIASTPGGQKVHVDLTNEVLLQANTLYALRIESSLSGLGLYYANRITTLEHNEPVTNEYVNGIARLGDANQPYTFKFALLTPEPSMGSTPPPSNQQMVISNAHIVAVSDTSVTVAWTTNLASDSRLSLRRQLYPQYVVLIGYDSTIELEHAVTISGLDPDTYYFADSFSTASNQTYSTYTIGFKTLVAQQNQNTPSSTPPVTPPPTTPTSTPPVPPPTTPPDTTPPPTTPPPTTPPPTTPPDNTTPPPTTPPDNSDNPGGLEPTPGSNGTDAGFDWPAPEYGEPSGGYRIDIFDHNYNLQRSISVASGTHHQDVIGLGAGLHHAIVYANEDGAFIKVASSTSFLLSANSNTTETFIIGLSAFWFAALGGWLFWRSKRKKVAAQSEVSEES